MHKIRPWLTVANCLTTQNTYALEKHNVGAMLQLAVHAPHDHIPVCYHPITDGIPLTDDQIHTALDFVRQHHANDQHIMIACRAGACRSVTFAIAALMDIENVSLADAYRDIKHQHSAARPFYPPLQSVAAYFGQTFTEDDYNQLKAEFDRPR